MTEIALQSAIRLEKEGRNEGWMERRREGGRKKSQEDGMNEHTGTKKGRKQAKPLEHSFKEEMSFRKCT